MSARAAPSFGVVLSLALLGAGRSHALSLRSSAAESFLGDVAPGTAVVYSRATGARLRVEDSGPEPARIRFEAVSPPVASCKDGWEPWPYPDKVRVQAFHPEIKAGEAAEAELSVSVPRDASLAGGQYQIDVLAAGTDRGGASLKLKTRVLLSVGDPPASARDVPDGGWSDMPGFTLAPPSAGPVEVRWGRGSDPGGGATLKLVNAGEDDVTVSLKPARDWSDDARIKDGDEPAPDPRWLRFETGAVKVRAGAIGSVRVHAEVPRERRYAGRRFALVAAVDAVAKGKRTRRWFVLSVVTPDWEEDSRTR